MNAETVEDMQERITEIWDRAWAEGRPMTEEERKETEELDRKIQRKRGGRLSKW